MNTKQASVKLSYEKTSAPGTVSVKLRVSYQRERRRYSFPLKEPVLVSIADFERLYSYHLSGSRRAAQEVKNLYGELEPFLKKAQAITDKLIPFSFERFKISFYGADLPTAATTQVVMLLHEKAARLEKQGKIANADSYKASARSLDRFVASVSPAERQELMPDSEALLLSHVTGGFLSRYEAWMLQSGSAPRKPGGQASPASLTTVGIYTRNLRSIFNDAIGSKLISQDAYPFAKKDYTIPASVNTKKALSKDDVLKIVSYQPRPGSAEERAKDFWVFSYLSNGMNLSDIFRLRWKDLDLEAGTLSFIRQKTTQTRKAKQVKIVANLFAESRQVLARWGNPARGHDDYVFPFLDEGMNARRQKAVVAQLIKQTNKYMTRIGAELGITGEVNTYAARHSFATILLRSEAPVAFISQSLGHTSLKTTEDYLGSFEDEQTKKYLSNLL